jgi:two-component system, LytTR family, response regulator
LTASNNWHAWYRRQEGCMGGDDRLIAERSHRLYFLRVSDVDYIEAYGNYVRIHVGDCEYVRRDTLVRLTRELQGAGFHRVRRSALLNMRRVAFAERLGDGALVFTLASGARLVSRTRFRLAHCSAGPAATAAAVKASP